MTRWHHLILPLLVAAGAACAQLPSSEEWARAAQAVDLQARQSGLQLRSGTLWRAALLQRAPLVAAHAAGVCHLGYAAYTPGRDYDWFFPPMGPLQRARWLAGVMHHELAHCAEQAAGDATADTLQALALGGDGQRWHEVLGDLAFALHVDQPLSPQGAALVDLLAGLRRSNARRDPVHDTAAELQCYLRQRGEFNPEGPWLARLQAWRQRCWQGSRVPAARGPG